MMNDRFSAELRQHLLTAADERPADGRLETINASVAVTAQRHPLVARLPWSPGRINPFPPVAMRYGLIVALIIAIVAAALAAGVVPIRRTVFEGTWTSIDPADGSTQTLVVGPGQDPAVRFVDDFATGAACVADEVKVFRMEGIGTIADGRLHVAWPEGGGCGLAKVEVGPGSYTHDQATDTLVDGQELIWVRANGDAVPPTRAPVTPRPATPIPTAVPNCVQFDAPSRYTAPAGSLWLTVSVPASAESPWLGHRDGFHLMRASCTASSGPGKIEGSEVTQVYADTCDRAGTSVAVETTAEAIAAVAAAKGIEVVEQTDVTVGGHTGTQFDLFIPEQTGSCPDAQVVVADGVSPFDETGNFTLYLIDVEGKTLALALFGNRDWSPAVIAEADAILASMQIAPTPDGTSVAPTELPSSELTSDPSEVPTSGTGSITSGCIDFKSEAPYTANVGSLPVSLTVPGTPGAPWSGDRDGFSLRKATCDGPGLPLFHAAVVDYVYTDACHWRASAVETPTASDVVAALQVQQGHDTIGPIETTLGPYPATRFDFSVQQGFDRGTCDRDGLPWVKVWGDEILVGGGTKQVYVADVDGVALVVTVGYYPGEITTTGLAEIDAILATLRVGS